MQVQAPLTRGPARAAVPVHPTACHGSPRIRGGRAQVVAVDGLDTTPSDRRHGPPPSPGPRGCGREGSYRAGLAIGRPALSARLIRFPRGTRLRLDPQSHLGPADAPGSQPQAAAATAASCVRRAARSLGHLISPSVPRLPSCRAGRQPAARTGICGVWLGFWGQGRARSATSGPSRGRRARPSPWTMA